MARDKGRKTKVLGRNFSTIKNVLPMFNPQAETRDWHGFQGIVEVPSGFEPL